MTHQTQSIAATQKPRLLPLFAIGLLLLVALVTILLTSAASAETEGTNTIYLPAITTPLAFEATLISSDFSSIAHITHAGDERLFIVERDGRIQILHPNNTITTFLDWRDNVFCCSGEEGMFAVAFHPNYAENGYFYVSYIGEKWDSHWLLVDRFTVSANPDVADANSAVRIFNVNMGTPLHNGGGLAFHPLSGNLFLGVGDDQGSLIAQEESDKGRVLELIVDTFPDVGKIRTAKGLRNPWRLNFDPVSGDLYVGEVGDDSWEEVNLIPNGAEDMNFGWPCYEGTDLILDCAHFSTFPIYQYPHNPARAIIGGPVYRHDAAEVPRYIFGDLATKQIFTLEPTSMGYTVNLEGTLPDSMTFLYSFGAGSDGTLYAGGFGGGLYEIHIPGVTP